jgi:hypothetical protein
MRHVAKLGSLVLVVALVAPTALAPVAIAQTQTDPYPDTLKTSPSGSREHEGAYKAGAVAANVFYVPGRAITCGLGGGAGVFLMLLTFGTAYKQAKFFVEEGCAGKWVLDEGDLRRANTERGLKDDSYFNK